MNHHSMEHEVLREISWHEAEPAMRAILERGANAYLRELPNNARAFHTSNPVCACIDERVGGDKFALAGSGILLDRDAAARIIRDNHLQAISSHEHCGAAALAFKALSPELQSEYGSADAYARTWTKTMAADLGLDYAGHVSVPEGDQHIARVVYYDATGTFNPSAMRADGWPPGFLVSRYRDQPEMTMSTIGLATDIATGHHGFGAMFTPDSPLVIIPVGQEDELPQLRQEIEQAISGKNYRQSLIIDSGLVAPSEATAKAA